MVVRNIYHNVSQFLKLVISILVCQWAGAIDSLFTLTPNKVMVWGFTSPAITAPSTSSGQAWYTGLQKPSFNPPNWVFVPVWTLLFLLMGIALYLIWSSGVESKKKRTAILIFAVQLILNILWSILFFGLKSPLYAFIEIIILWLAILLTIISFYKISKPAAYLLLPYILWVSFASVLNLSILILNL